MRVSAAVRKSLALSTASSAGFCLGSFPNFSHRPQVVLEYCSYKSNQGGFLQEDCFPLPVSILPHTGSGSKQQKPLLAIHKWHLPLGRL